MAKPKKKSNSQKLVIIDGHALIHRSFHALPPLSTQKGKLINAAYGFTSILLKTIKELKPDYLACTFDVKGPTFREEEFADYKATRPRPAEELTEQIPIVKEVVKAFNIPIYEKQGFEADDIIGTICHRVKDEENLEVIIVTGDLDTLQLVDEKVKVYTLKKGIKETIVYDREKVKERYQIEPSQLIDFKGLKGDPSDNIPGVPGIGEKGAINLIKQFGSLENLYQKIAKADISPPLKTKLLENKDQALFSKKLATIKKDVEIEFNLKNCRLEDYSKEKVVDLFKKLEFYSLIERIPQSEKNPVSQSLAEPDILDKIEQNLKDEIFSQKVYQIEKDLMPVIAKMEKTGIKVDVGYLKDLSKELEGKIENLASEIYKLAGLRFNISSSQQLAEVLFERLKVSTDEIRKTPGGVFSTAASELEKLKEKHPVIKLIEEYRELTKLKSTYTDALPKMVDPKTSRVHTSFHQLGTVTGRLSSSEPNLQNIPIRTKIGQGIRKAFIAEKDFKLLSADYSQLELRIIASIAADEKMIEAFRKGQDIHKTTASEVFNVPPEEVTPSMRHKSKALNFGLVYGMSIQGFAEAAGIDRAKAKEFIENYMKKFTGVANYIEEAKKQAREKGYAETLLGRRRYLPELHSSNFLAKNSAERMAINMPIQGTTSDIMKLAMIEIDSRCIDSSTRMLVQVHDELVFEIKKDLVEEKAKIIKQIMEGAYKLAAPLKVDFTIGDNWGEMIRYKL